MTRELPPNLEEQLVTAWDDYAAGTTPEARFVRQMDKLETLLQAELYLDQHPEIVIDSFRLGAAPRYRGSGSAPGYSLRISLRRDDWPSDGNSVNAADI